MSHGWNNPKTAEKYEAYAQTHNMYRDTSRDLVRFAAISKNMSVIDLCCGTGITSEAILQQLAETGHCYALDLSPAMLEVARKKLLRKNISFHEFPAEQVHTITNEPVERIVCNSAFWQVNIDETLAAAHQALIPKGLFTFNLPGGFYDIPDDNNSRQDAPHLRTRMRQIAKSDYGYTFPQFKSNNSWQLNYESVLVKVNTNGFKLQHYEILAYEQSQAASFEFCTIPIMTERVLPNVPYETRIEILKKATQSTDANATFSQKWAFFVLSS